jgi:hypothetical protein
VFVTSEYNILLLKTTLSNNKLPGTESFLEELIVIQLLSFSNISVVRHTLSSQPYERKIPVSSTRSPGCTFFAPTGEWGIHETFPFTSVS